MHARHLKAKQAVFAMCAHVVPAHVIMSTCAASACVSALPFGLRAQCCALGHGLMITIYKWCYDLKNFGC